MLTFTADEILRIQARTCLQEALAVLYPHRWRDHSAYYKIADGIGWLLAQLPSGQFWETHLDCPLAAVEHARAKYGEAVIALVRLEQLRAPVTIDGCGLRLALDNAHEGLALFARAALADSKVNAWGGLA